MIEADTAAARDALHDLAAGLAQAATLALKSAVAATAQSVAQTGLYHDRTGKTRGSLVSAASGLEGFVSSGAATRFLEAGTRPHVIEAKAGGTLRFQVAGETVFRRRVNHPGTSPRPFMEVARAVGEQAADYAADYFADYAIGRHNA